MSLKSPAYLALSLALIGVTAGCSPATDSNPGPSKGTGGSGGQSSSGGQTGTGGSSSGTGGTSSSTGGTTGSGGTTTTPDGTGGTVGGSGGSSGSKDAGGGDTGGGASDAGTDGGGNPSASPRSGRSAGCGKPVMGTSTAWLRHDVMPPVAPAYAASNGRRAYFTRPPAGYDPAKAYPVTFWGHGCGASGAENTPLMGGDATKESIHVFLLAANSCFSTSNADSPELPYFDMALSQIEDNFCVDKGKIFLAGFSSGGWLGHLLACGRGDVIRGIGTAAGGMLVNKPPCQGPVAAMMTGDTGDNNNPITRVDPATGVDRGSGAGRDRILKTNGCSNETVPWDPAYPGCVSYQGCKPGYPVVWCQTSGQGHSDGGNLSRTGFWKFWKSLP